MKNPKNFYERSQGEFLTPNKSGIFHRLIFMKYAKMFGYVFLILGLFVSSSIAGTLIVGTVYLLKAEVVTMSAENIASIIADNVLLSSILSSLITMLLYWVVFLFRKRSLGSYSLPQRIPLSYIGISLLIGLCFSFTITGFISVAGIERYFPDHQVLIQSVLLGKGFWLPLLGVGILAPIVEEVAFRGLIFNRMREDISLKAALILQAIFFGAIHLNMLQSSYAFIIGLFLGIGYVWTNSLYVPILMHIGLNSTSVLMAQIPQIESNAIVLFSMFVIGFTLLLIITKVFKKQTKQPLLKSAEY